MQPPIPGLVVAHKQEVREPGMGKVEMPLPETPLETLGVAHRAQPIPGQLAAVSAATWSLVLNQAICIEVVVVREFPEEDCRRQNRKLSTHPYTCGCIVDTAS